MILAVLISFFNDRGEVRTTDAWRGLPTIVAPIYTRCPVACPMIVSGLKRALAESNAQPGTYRVVLFSFDARDTPADLRRFREQHRVPIDWTVASARDADIRALTDSIGFRFAQSRGGFTHPNMIVGLTPDLQVAGVLNGTEYRAGDIERLLAGRDFLERYAGPLTALLLFAALGAAAYAVMPRARARIAPAPDRSDTRAAT